MANIPLGDFAQARAVPRVEARGVNMSPLNERGSGAAALGDALQRAGNIMGNEAAAMKAQETAEHEKAQAEADAVERAKAANKLSERQLEIEGAVAGVQDWLRTGGDYAKAEGKLEEEISKLPAIDMPALDPVTQEHFQGGLANAAKAGRLKINGAIVAARRDDGQKQFAQFLDTNGKLAGLPGADIEKIHAQAKSFADNLVPAFGVDQSQTATMLQNWMDRNWTNDATAKFNGAQDNPEALAKLREDLTSEKGGYADKLDATKRNSLALLVGNRIDSLQAKSERAADKALSAWEKSTEQMEEQFSSTVPPTAEQMTSWAAAAKASGKEAEFNTYIQGVDEVSKILRLPIDQQVAELNKRDLAIHTKGGDKKDRANFARFESAVKENIRMLKEEPLTFAQVRDTEKITPINPAALMDPAQAGTVSAELAHRAIVIGAYRKKYGDQVRDTLLTNNEAAAVIDVMNKVPADKKVGMYGGLRKLAGSDQSYLSIMGQIAKEKPVAALAGMLAIQGERGRKGAELLVIGDDALTNNKGLKMPSPTELNAAIDSSLGNLFRDRPDGYKTAVAAIRAGYAGAVTKDGGQSDEFDADRLKNIIEVVVGKSVDYNGRGKVLVPYNSDPDDFDDNVERAWKGGLDLLAPGTPTDLSQYGLQNMGDGIYYVTNGRAIVYNKYGKPHKLSLNWTKK